MPNKKELKEAFDAGYDYRSSLMPEIINRFGINSQPTFEKWIKGNQPTSKEYTCKQSAMKKLAHGGKRPGSGRPKLKKSQKKEETVVMRIPKSKVAIVLKAIGKA